jgi:hypothetical protein
MPRLFALVPEVDDVQAIRDEAKNKKWVPFNELLALPERLLEDAKKRFCNGSGKKPVAMALAFRNSLLMTWLVHLAWRQRNLRELKFGPREQGGNLFKCALDPLATIARPDWAEELLQQNPREELWQVYFRPEETKTGHAVHIILPRHLGPPLEEYVRDYRPLLVKGTDPGFLFLNSEGRPLSANRMDDLVESLTLRFVGRRVNPHLVRDIFALSWLEEHPEDYLTLSKILWHRSIETTLRIYGTKFNESHGVRRAEQWLEERLKRDAGGAGKPENGPAGKKNG